MLKKIKSIVMVIVAMILLMANVMSVYANEFDAVNRKMIKEGYTENGDKYMIYEIVPDDKMDISPRITVSKEVEVHVTFTGHITPPSSFAYNEYDNDYKTQMTGSLKLVSYVKDYDFIMRKETRARYKGVVFGQI